MPPLNLLGDFGAGGTYLAFGMVCALYEARGSGRGQVVDAAITDGTAHLMAMIQALSAGGLWQDRREANLLDGAAPFYGTYRCACGGFVAVGAIEAKFYADLLRLLGLADEDLPAQMDRSGWPLLRDRFARAFATRTRAEWTALMEGTDACFAPVLTIAEAPDHPHNRARGTYQTIDGIPQPAPAPRLSRTPGQVAAASQSEPLDLQKVLARWGA